MRSIVHEESAWKEERGVCRLREGVGSEASGVPVGVSCVFPSEPLYTVDGYKKKIKN